MASASHSDLAIRLELLPGVAWSNTTEDVKRFASSRIADRQREEALISPPQKTIFGETGRRKSETWLEHTRPCDQFRQQVLTEIRSLQGYRSRRDLMYGEFPASRPDEKLLRPKAQDIVKNRWIEQGIWDTAWEKEGPGNHWKHEMPIVCESKSNLEPESQRVTRQRDRDASRPFQQFMYQLFEERERARKDLIAEGLIGDVKPIVKAYENVKARWIKEGAWKLDQWGEVPPESEFIYESFIDHLNNERRELDKMMAELAYDSHDINTTAYETVKRRWDVRGIWDHRWGILPGSTWMHEVLNSDQQWLEYMEVNLRQWLYSPADWNHLEGIHNEFVKVKDSLTHKWVTLGELIGRILDQGPDNLSPSMPPQHHDVAPMHYRELRPFLEEITQYREPPNTEEKLAFWKSVEENLKKSRGDPSWIIHKKVPRNHFGAIPSPPEMHDDAELRSSLKDMWSQRQASPTETTLPTATNRSLSGPSKEVAVEGRFTHFAPQPRATAGS